MEQITDELREWADSHGLQDELYPIADRIDVRADDECSYASAQTLNEVMSYDGGVRYAHDVGFDEGYEAAMHERWKDEDEVGDGIDGCPFCGGDAELTIMLLGDGGVAYAVVCSDCKAETAFFTDEERAVAAWNVRVDA